MSDIDSTAATQATSVPQSPSSHASIKSTQGASTPHTRSSSPLGRSPKRRRLESVFPENCYAANDTNIEDETNNSPLAQSIFLNSASSINLQPTFMGHDREFMSYIISTRGGVMQWERGTARSRHHLPESHFGAEGLPAISADHSSFVGWREKAETWPMEKIKPMRRSYTYPE